MTNKAALEFKQLRQGTVFLFSKEIFQVKVSVKKSSLHSNSVKK